MVQYWGILDGSDRVWGVFIPDWPGVHGGGATAQQAVDDAHSALLEIALMRSTDLHDLPIPTGQTDLLADAEIADAIGRGDRFVAVTLDLPD